MESNKEPELVCFASLWLLCWMASADRKGGLRPAWLLQVLMAWWLTGKEEEKQW